MLAMTIAIPPDRVRIWRATLEKVANFMVDNREDLAEEVAILRQIANQLLDTKLIGVECPQFVVDIPVEDPDTHGQVELSAYKTSGGGIVAIDFSYLDQVRAIVPSPFDDHVLLDLREKSERE